MCTVYIGTCTNALMRVGRPKFYRRRPGHVAPDNTRARKNVIYYTIARGRGLHVEHTYINIFSYIYVYVTYTKSTTLAFRIHRHCKGEPEFKLWRTKRFTSKTYGMYRFLIGIPVLPVKRAYPWVSAKNTKKKPSHKKFSQRLRTK